MFHDLTHLLSHFCQFQIRAWAEGGMAKIRVNQTQLSDQMDHPEQEKQGRRRIAVLTARWEIYEGPNNGVDRLVV